MGLFPELDKFDAAKAQMEGWLVQSGGYHALDAENRAYVDDWYRGFRTNRSLRVDELATRVGKDQGVRSMEELRQAVGRGFRFSDAAHSLAQLPDDGPIPTRAGEPSGRALEVPADDPLDVPPSQQVQAPAPGPEAAMFQELLAAATAQGPTGPEQPDPLGPISPSRGLPMPTPEPVEKTWGAAYERGVQALGQAEGVEAAPSPGVLGFGDPAGALTQYGHIAAQGLARTKAQMLAGPSVSDQVGTFNRQLGQNQLASWVMSRPGALEQMAETGWIDVPEGEVPEQLNVVKSYSDKPGHLRVLAWKGLSDALRARGVEFEPTEGHEFGPWRTANPAQLAVAMGDLASKSRAELSEESQAALAEDPAYRAAGDIERSAETRYPVKADYFDPIPGTESALAQKLGVEDGITTGDVAQGVVSTLPFIVGGTIGSAAGPVGTFAGAAYVARSTQPVMEFQEAIKRGADFGEAGKVMAGSELISMTEAIPVTVLFSRLDRIVGKGAVRRWLTTTAVEGGTELVQEMVSQFGHNALNRAVWDTERELGEGVAESGFIGLLTGALVGGATAIPEAGAEIKHRRDLKADEDAALSRTALELSMPMEKRRPGLQGGTELQVQPAAPMEGGTVQLAPEAEPSLSLAEPGEVAQLLGEVERAAQVAATQETQETPSILIGMLDALMRRRAQGDPLAAAVLESEVSSGVSVEQMLTEMAEGLSGPPTASPTTPATAPPSTPAEEPAPPAPESPALSAPEGFWTKALPEPEPAGLPLPTPELEVTVHAEGALVDLGDGLVGKVIESVEREGQVGHKVRAKGGEETWVWGELSPVSEAAPAQRLVEALRPLLGAPLDKKELFRLADEVYGGTRAAGTYTQKDAYDALELAVNQELAGWAGSRLDPSATDPAEGLAATQALLENLPAQGARTGEQQKLQQFSTPPPLAFLVNWLANLSAADTVLEPSAGVGGLAVFAKNTGADVVMNELSPRRRELLEVLELGETHGYDAEHLHALMAGKVSPSAVVMNPPFSQSQSGKKSSSEFGRRHVDQALELLQPGGRLVAILGRGDRVMDENGRWDGTTRPSQGHARWVATLGERGYTVRADVGLSGKGYAKYGTTFDSQVVVIDKVASADAQQPVTGMFSGPAEAAAALKEVRDARGEVTPDEQRPGARARSPGARGAQGARPAGPAAPATTPEPVPGPPAPGAPGRPEPEPDGGELGGPEPGEVPELHGEEPGGAPAVGVEPAPGGRPAPAGTPARAPRERPARPGTGVGPRLKRTARSTDEKSPWQRWESSSRVALEGAQPHPGPLVETASMASVELPDVDYVPDLPAELITSGELSEAQLETVVYAGAAHERMLPTGERRAYMTGDGTGAGKTRQILGVVLDNWRKGRKRHVILSPKDELFDSLLEELESMGIEIPVVRLGSSGKRAVAKGTPIGLPEGIVFSTYSKLAHDVEVSNEFHAADDALAQHTKKQPLPGKLARLDQLVAWLGDGAFGTPRDGFEGVLVFDEAHKMGNLIPEAGDPSLTALAGAALQGLAPQARILYATATSGQEVEQLAFAYRLGLWGEGTQFADVAEFVSNMRLDGLAAMEIVARELKMRGLYSARSIAFDGWGPDGDESVSVDTVEHELTEDQAASYDLVARVWQDVTAGRERSMVSANTPRAARKESVFWSGQQRFFQLFTMMQRMPTALRQIQEELDEGHAVLIQVFNTMDSELKAALAAVESETDLGALDVSPKRVLMQLLEEHWPTIQYVEEMDPLTGKLRLVPLIDLWSGAPVESPTALDERDRLLDSLARIPMFDSPLDTLLKAEFTDEEGQTHRGYDWVAEVTGRNERVEWQPDPKTGELRAQRTTRTESARRQERQEFNDDERRILVFSMAKGGTGMSYHSDKRFKNQRRRVLLALQYGWSAKDFMQGLGRGHRSNQAHAPRNVMMRTPQVPAEARFATSVLRRLMQLGAITQGERSASGASMFRPEDNLETRFAADALTRLVREVFDGTVTRADGTVFTIEELEERLGTVVTTEEEDAQGDPVPGTKTLLTEHKFTGIDGVRRFLNRSLMLELDDQAVLFEGFEERLVARLAVAEAQGEAVAAQGMQFMEGRTIQLAGEPVTVHTDRETGQPTKVLTLDIEEEIKYRDFDFAEKYRMGNSRPDDTGFHVVFHRAGHPADGMVYAVGALVDKADQRAGTVTSLRHALGADGSYRAITEDELRLGTKAGEWEVLDVVDTAQRRWGEYVEQAPQSRQRVRYLLTGMMLNVWNSLTGVGRVFRVKTESGERYIGREVFPRKVEGLLSNFGVDVEAWQAGLPATVRKRQLNPGQVLERVLEGVSFDLDNGWRIRRSRVEGEDRVEVLNPEAELSSAEVQRLVKWGVQEMRIQYRMRLFVPTGDGGTILGRIMKGRRIQAERAAEDRADESSYLGDIDKDLTAATSEIVPAVRDARPAQRTPRTAGEILDYSPAPGIVLEYEVVSDDGRTVRVQRVSSLGKPQLRRIPKQRFEVGVTRADALDEVAAAVWHLGRDPARRHRLPPELQALSESPDPLMPDRDFDERRLGDVRTKEGFGPKLEMAMESRIPEGQEVGIHEVMRAIQGIVPTVPLRVPIPAGRRRRGLRGYFAPDPKVVRVDSFSNLTTAVHEMGHALEDSLYGHVQNVPHLRAMGREIIRELADLGRELYGTKRPAAGYMREGYAEFLLYYVAERATAEDKAPRFLEAFESMLEGDPGLKASIEHATELLGRYREQGADLRAVRNIETGHRGPTPYRVFQKFLNWEMWTDDLDPLLQFDRFAEGVGGKPVRQLLADLGLGDHPTVHEAATRFAGTSSRLVRKFVEEGVQDLAGNRVGDPLQKWNQMALRDGTRWEFYAYLWARRSLERLGWHWNPESETFERSMRLTRDGDEAPVEPRDPGMTLPDAQHLFLKYHDRPNFRRAAQGYYDWNKLVLNYALEAGLISPADRARILAGSGDYIPLRRMFDEIGEEQTAAIASAAREGRPIPRFRGSGRRIIDPMQSMVENAERLVRLSHKAKVLQMVVALAGLQADEPGKPGMGRYVEEVPVARHPVSFSLDRIARQLDRAGVIDRDTMTDEELEQILTVFVENPVPSPTGRPIIPHWQNGRVRWYEVDPDLYRALQGMDMYRLPTLAQWVTASDLQMAELPGAIAGSTLAPLTRVFRLGTTGLSASFSLVTNPIRDFPTFLFNSRSWSLRGDRSAYGHLAYLTKLWWQEWWAAARHAFGGERSEANAVFSAVGGELSLPLGPDTRHTRRAVEEAWWEPAGRARRLVRSTFSHNVIDHLRDFIGFPETATRAAELRALAELTGVDLTGQTPLTLEQTTDLAIAAKSVTVNFGAGGRWAKSLNQVVPFFNANIQGPRIVKQTLQRDRWSAVLRGLHLTLLTSLLWWMNKDEEWYQRMSFREKWSFFNIPVKDTDGNVVQVLRVPRPFDIGNLFSVMPEAALNAAYEANDGDPEAFRELTSAFEHAVRTTTPPFPTETPAVKFFWEQATNRVGFWDRPVSTMEASPFRTGPTEEDVRPFTTSTARALGAALPPWGKSGVGEPWKSPARIEHAARTFAGPTGMELLRIPDYILRPVMSGQRKEFEAADIPVIGRIFWRGGEAGVPVQAVQDIFERREDLKRQEGASKERLQLTDQEADELRHLNRASRKITKILREASSASTLEERNRKKLEVAEVATEAWKTRLE